MKDNSSNPDNSQAKFAKIPSGGYGIVTREAMRNAKLTLHAKIVYAYLCTLTGSKNFCWPRLCTIVSELKISKRSAIKAIKLLELEGYLKKEKLNPGSLNKQNKYTIYHKETIESIQPAPSKGADEHQPEGVDEHPVNNNINNNNINNKDADKSAGPSKSEKPKTEIDIQAEKMFKYWKSLVPDRKDKYSKRIADMIKATIRQYSAKRTAIAIRNMIRDESKYGVGIQRVVSPQKRHDAMSRLTSSAKVPEITQKDIEEEKKQADVLKELLNG